MKTNLISKSETATLLKTVSEKWKIDVPKVKNLKVYEIDNEIQLITGEQIKILKIKDEHLPFLSEISILEKFPFVQVDMGAVKFMCKGANLMRPGIKKFSEFSKNDIVLADDGTLKFTVTRVIGKDIYLKALTKGVLKSSKGINVPHITIGGALITKRDIKMINFAKSNEVDFIGISFVESAKHIKKIRSLINSHSPYIVAKIENQKGLENLEEIIDATDAIMIDRGDLSTETDIESLALNQKHIIKKAKINSTPVIVATEMLDNMIKNPFPTKAEVLDISNSILDGASATMLSGETAVGDFPVESIKVMSNISSALMKRNINEYEKFDQHASSMATGKAITTLCSLLPITKVIVITMSGHAARIVSSQNLSQPIIAESNDKKVSRSLNLLAGVTGIFYGTKFYKDSLDHIPKCLFYLWKNKEILSNDMILLTALGFPGSGQRMNIIQTHSVKGLKNLFSWK